MAPNSEKEFDLFSDDNDDFNAKHEVNYPERFRAATMEIRKRRFTHESDVEEFLLKYEDIVGKPAAKVGGNLLHKLIEVVEHNADDVESENVELLVRRMVNRWPSLLKDTNKDEHNPLFVAIRNSQHKLVDYMISACEDSDCLDSALSKRAQEGKTCIHVAFTEEKLHPDTAKMLVEIASDEALAVQDDFGNTPMHYAVSFTQWYKSFSQWSSQSVDVRGKLIALFIARDLRARQSTGRPQPTFLDHRAKSGRSVYREHEYTKAQVVKKYEAHLVYLARQRQGAAANTQVQVDAARSATRSAPRDPRAKGRDLRQGASSEPNGDRITEKYGSSGDADDKREKERRRRKAEEAKKKAEETNNLAAEETKRPEDTDAPVRNVRVGERDATGREASRIQSAGTDGSGENMSLPVQQELGACNAGYQNDPAPNTPIKRSNTARFDSNPEQQRGKEKEPARPSPTPQGRSNDAYRMTELLKKSNAILQTLKQHYMRTRSAEMAISFLYGNNMDDIQISFDYDRLPRKMLWNDFVKKFGADAKSGLRFDRVLQYVTLPHVEVTLQGRQADRERETQLQQVGLRGRKDMQYFFDWLYKKGVRHIIRVSVEDSGESGEKVHSDRAIQESLEKFIVEHLDWKKIDLDPEIILRVGSKAEKETSTLENPEKAEIVPDRQLKQLYLRWSGSNAVLRAWSEPEGLAMLPHLKKIFLFTPPDDKKYDSEQWIIERVRDFQARLNASRQAALSRVKEQLQHDPAALSTLSVFDDVDVRLADSVTDEERNVSSSDAPHLTTSAAVKGVNSHRWLDSTTRFAGEMIHFWPNTVKEFLESRKNVRTQEGFEDDVVLALIDDGVDRFDTPQTNQILEGKSFDFHNGKIRPPFSSAKGHGTVMASMILRVCPMVKVYPIRLKTYDNPEGKNMKIDADYAAQAIQAALDKKATIISMSWTIPMTESESELKKTPLHKVLETAVERGVLMFCSTPDSGKFTDVDYPSGPWRDRFFRIGAANAAGTVFQWTPEDGITYVLPGVDVVREQAASGAFDAHSMRGIPNRMVEFHETGSSVATALAAGLAAMIIYCVKASILAVKTANQKNIHLPGTFPDNAAELIAHPDEMKRAFASLGRVTPNNFVQVWDELDKISGELEASQAPTPTPELKQKGIDAFVNFGQKLLGAAQKH